MRQWKEWHRAYVTGKPSGSVKQCYKHQTGTMQRCEGSANDCLAPNNLQPTRRLTAWTQPQLLGQQHTTCGWTAVCKVKACRLPQFQRIKTSPRIFINLRGWEGWYFHSFWQCKNMNVGYKLVLEWIPQVCCYKAIITRSFSYQILPFFLKLTI